MPIPTRAGIFLILGLVAMLFSPRLLTLNILAFAQWHPSIKNFEVIATKATQTCIELRKRLGSKVVQVYGERSYIEAIRNPASLFNSVYRPTCVVAPRDASDVQITMAAVYRDKVRYAVMSGGHTGMTGWNTCVYFPSCSSMFDRILQCSRRCIDFLWKDGEHYL